jgi:hypothetical protein
MNKYVSGLFVLFVLLCSTCEGLNDYKNEMIKVKNEFNSHLINHFPKEIKGSYHLINDFPVLLKKNGRAGSTLFLEYESDDKEKLQKKLENDPDVLSFDSTDSNFCIASNTNCFSQDFKNSSLPVPNFMKIIYEAKFNDLLLDIDIDKLQYYLIEKKYTKTKKLNNADIELGSKKIIGTSRGIAIHKTDNHVIYWLDIWIFDPNPPKN